jgi:endonuclease V-like protein UPF0215 family
LLVGVALAGTLTAYAANQNGTANQPGTYLRVETDSDGVYEAHLTTDGKRVTVEVDKAFKVTGEESGPGRP